MLFGNYNPPGFTFGAADFGVISIAPPARLLATRREADVVIADHGAALVVITLGAAVVNGALGYGFSSITVPLALLFLTNRVLNPALVLDRGGAERVRALGEPRRAAAVWRRVLPIVVGLAPGVVVGTLMVVARQPGWLKLVTFVVLLPLILLQAAGYRRPIRSERSVGLSSAPASACSTRSRRSPGPPLAVVLNNQGFAKQEFRAALGFIRLAESTFTAVAYCVCRPVHAPRASALMPWILPSMLIGVPIGAVAHPARSAPRRSGASA